MSAYSQTGNQLDFSYRLATAVRDRRCVQLLLSALQSNERYLDECLPQVIAGFELHQTPPPMTEKRGTVNVDHRLGFRVTSPGGWQFKDATPPQLLPLGTICIAAGQDGACAVTAICSPSGVDEELALDAMMQHSRFKTDPGSRVESQSTLAGLPARQISMSGRQGHDRMSFKVWMAKRANTTFCVQVFTKQGSRRQRKIESFKRCLTLID